MSFGWAGSASSFWRKPRTAIRKYSTRSTCAGPHTDLRSWRSEEHTSELQSLMRISYAVFCLKKKNKIYLCKQTRLHAQHMIVHTIKPETNHISNKSLHENSSCRQQ